MHTHTHTIMHTHTHIDAVVCSANTQINTAPPLTLTCLVWFTLPRTLYPIFYLDRWCRVLARWCFHPSMKNHTLLRIRKCFWMTYKLRAYTHTHTRPFGQGKSKELLLAWHYGLFDMFISGFYMFSFRFWKLRLVCSLNSVFSLPCFENARNGETKIAHTRRLTFPLTIPSSSDFGVV